MRCDTKTTTTNLERNDHSELLRCQLRTPPLHHLTTSVPSLPAASHQLPHLPVHPSNQLQHLPHPLEPLILYKPTPYSLRRGRFLMTRLGMLPPVDLCDLYIGLLGSLHIDVLLARVAEALDDLISLAWFGAAFANAEFRGWGEGKTGEGRDAVEILKVVVVGGEFGLEELDATVFVAVKAKSSVFNLRLPDTSRDESSDRLTTRDTCRLFAR